MAAWQYDFHLVPRKGVIDLYGTVPPCLDRETFETAHWWREVAIADLDVILSSLLERGVSWDPAATITWGKEDGNRVDVLFESGTVRECFVRADMRVLMEGFLAAILRLASEQDWLIITPDLRVFEPTGEAIVADLARSGALKFVNDPEGFFRALKQK
jgi:hypothetical protein